MVICKLHPSIIGYISMKYIYCMETVYFMMFGLELCWAGLKKLPLALDGLSGTQRGYNPAQ